MVPDPLTGTHVQATRDKPRPFPWGASLIAAISMI
jgi:hypothetical protein